MKTRSFEEDNNNSLVDIDDVVMSPTRSSRNRSPSMRSSGRSRSSSRRKSRLETVAGRNSSSRSRNSNSSRPIGKQKKSQRKQKALEMN